MHTILPGLPKGYRLVSLPTPTCIGCRNKDDITLQAKQWNIGTKCNSLAQQFIRISTTIDIWVTCFDTIESSSGPQRLQIQLLQGGQVHCGIPMLT